MVKSLSNKCVPVPSLNKIEIDILHSLRKDFCQQAHKRAAAVRLHKYPKSHADLWHELEKPDDGNQNWYGLGSHLYKTILAHPEIDSGHPHFESFLDKLEMEFENIMKSLCKK
jgi:hypothetical protein